MQVEFSSAAGLRYSDTGGDVTLVCNDWGGTQLVWIDDRRDGLLVGSKRMGAGRTLALRSSYIER